MSLRTVQSLLFITAALSGRIFAKDIVDALGEAFPDDDGDYAKDDYIPDLEDKAVFDEDFDRAVPVRFNKFLLNMDVPLDDSEEAHGHVPDHGQPGHKHMDGGHEDEDMGDDYFKDYALSRSHGLLDTNEGDKNNDETEDNGDEESDENAMDEVGVKEGEDEVVPEEHPLTDEVARFDGDAELPQAIVLLPEVDSGTRGFQDANFEENQDEPEENLDDVEENQDEDEENQDEEGDNQDEENANEDDEDTNQDEDNTNQDDEDTNQDEENDNQDDETNQDEENDNEDDEDTNQDVGDVNIDDADENVDDAIEIEIHPDAFEEDQEEKADTQGRGAPDQADEDKEAPNAQKQDREDTWDQEQRRQDALEDAEIMEVDDGELLDDDGDTGHRDTPVVPVRGSGDRPDRVNDRSRESLRHTATLRRAPVNRTYQSSTLLLFAFAAVAWWLRAPLTQVATLVCPSLARSRKGIRRKAVEWEV